jgi:hypothetical protein
VGQVLDEAQAGAAVTAAEPEPGDGFAPEFRVPALAEGWDLERCSPGAGAFSGVAARIFALASARGRVPEAEDEKPPVRRIVLAGLFAGVCALAFMVGVLRGMMIEYLGR